MGEKEREDRKYEAIFGKKLEVNFILLFLVLSTFYKCTSLYFMKYFKRSVLAVFLDLFSNVVF